MDEMTPDYFTARNQIMEKYNYGMMADGTDYNIPATVIFNPYYSIVDWMEFLNVDSSEEFEKFSLLGKVDYRFHTITLMEIAIIRRIIN